MLRLILKRLQRVAITKTPLRPSTLLVTNQAPLYLTLCSSYAIFADVKKIEGMKHEETEPVDKELYKQTYKENDEALRKLMVALTFSVSEASNKYRENLSKQMKLMMQSVKNRTFGDGTDELALCREEAKKLKDEIDEWKNYVDKVGHVVLKHAVASFKAGNEDARDLFVKYFRKLDTCMKDQLNANHLCEIELLVLSRDCFLQYIQEGNLE